MGKCPHLHYQFTTGAFPRHDYICSECNQTFNAPHCPQYHRSWDAVFGSLVPEMEQRGWLLLYERFSGNWEGAPLDRPYSFVKFFKEKKGRASANHEDGRIAIILSALAAVEMEKK